jgi:hypothetical protein
MEVENKFHEYRSVDTKVKWGGKGKTNAHADKMVISYTCPFFIRKGSRLNVNI